eukprot:3203456-Rhodomonas_salina.3
MGTGVADGDFALVGAHVGHVRAEQEVHRGPWYQHTQRQYRRGGSSGSSIRSVSTAETRHNGIQVVLARRFVYVIAIDLDLRT